MCYVSARWGHLYPVRVVVGDGVGGGGGLRVFVLIEQLSVEGGKGAAKGIGGSSSFRTRLLTF